MSAPTTTKPGDAPSLEPQVAAEAQRPAPGQGEQRTSGRTLVLVTVVLALSTMLVLPVQGWFSQRQALDSLRADNEQARERVQALEQQRAQWQTPSYLESQARLRLNMLRPGEAGLIMLPQDERDDAPIDLAPQASTWYGKVWQSVEVANGQRPADSSDE